MQTSVLYKHRCRNFCTIAKLSPQVQKRLHLCYIFAQVPVSKQINFSKRRLLFTPSINKCTGEIVPMEALVEMILTLVYSLIQAQMDTGKTWPFFPPVQTFSPVGKVWHRCKNVTPVQKFLHRRGKYCASAKISAPVLIKHWCLHQSHWLYLYFSLNHVKIWT